jgi:hypothetical protein
MLKKAWFDGTGKEALEAKAACPVTSRQHESKMTSTVFHAMRKVPRAKSLAVADIINSREKIWQECSWTETAATEDPKREEEA